MIAVGEMGVANTLRGIVGRPSGGVVSEREGLEGPVPFSLERASEML